MDINIQNKKLELIQWLSTIEDKSLIEKILQLREKENEDWWQEISNSEKESIEKGLKDADEGNLSVYSQARKLYTDETIMSMPLAANNNEYCS